MDPNSLTNLDPKLRETYERVMGTSASAKSSAAAANSIPADQNPTEATPLPGTEAMPAPAPGAIPAPEPLDSLPSLGNSAPSPSPTGDVLSAPIAQSPLTSEQPQTVTINQPLPNPTAGNIITKPHGHMGLIRVFYILGAIVFFVIYVFFWMKIFNIKLPFLP